MARGARRVLVGEVHLVRQLACRGVAAVPDAAAAERLESALVQAAALCGVRLHALGIWSTELRLLVTPSEPSSLARTMQAVGRLYVPWLNQSTSGSGSPWAGRFQSAVVDPQSHFFQALRFVEGLGAGGSDAVPWRSSLGFHLGQGRAQWLTQHPRYWALGNTPFEREAAHARWREQPLAPAELLCIQRALSRGGALGDVAFLQSLERRTGLSWMAAPRGRPRKKIEIID
jgi:putative transposase